ncbi:hypothetical protein [Marinobacter sp.]|uniref:hypothetical protein n=1 Tax=Marinobacter sp. TaxID=50741 RepID=UPI0038511D89
MNILISAALLLLALPLKMHDIRQLRALSDPKRFRNYLKFLRSSVLFGATLHFGLQAVPADLPVWSALIIYPVLLVAYDSEYRGLVKTAG